MSLTNTDKRKALPAGKHRERSQEKDEILMSHNTKPGPRHRAEYPKRLLKATRKEAIILGAGFIICVAVLFIIGLTTPGVA